jgi:flagellar biosynthesis/type III secretory pathway chaperone
MAYFEGEIPTVVNGGGYNNNGGMWGGDGIWAILLLALLGNGGFGRGLGGGTGYGAGSEFVGYELGKTATQADVASGFNNSAVLSNLNDQKLALANGFAGVQQTLCQGFSGVNQTVLSGFAGVDNAICTLGYQNQQGFNALGQQLASCCCDLKQMNLENRYLNERQTCEIVNAINMGNQRLVDIYNNDKIDTLNRKLATAEAQLSNNAQSRYITDTILDKLSPCPRPAYITCNPNTGLTYPAGYTQANFGNNGCSGCGF